VTQSVTFHRIGKKVYLEKVLPNTHAVNYQAMLISLSSEHIVEICSDVICLETIGYHSCVCFEAIFFNSYLILSTKMTSFVFIAVPPRARGWP
jgi:hypothetical protein